jgi:nitric oxide reductase NorD protein
VSEAKHAPTLQVVPSGDDDATRPLHSLMRQRAGLRPSFRATWDELSHHFNPLELEAWAGAVLELAHVNAGSACLMAY